eukprot:6458724-Amphidinium_carterae.1
MRDATPQWSDACCDQLWGLLAPVTCGTAWPPRDTGGRAWQAHGPSGKCGGGWTRVDGWRWWKRAGRGEVMWQGGAAAVHLAMR